MWTNNTSRFLDTTRLNDTGKRDWFSRSVHVAGAGSRRELSLRNWGKAAMRVLTTAPGEVLDVAFSLDCRAVAAAVERPHLAANIFLWNLDSPTLSPVRLE